MERIFTMDKDFLGREKRKRRKSYACNCTEFARRRWIDHFHHFHPSPRKKKFGRTRCYKVARDGYFLSWKEATLLLFPLLPFSTRQSHASILRLVISRPTLRRWNRRFSFLSLSLLFPIETVHSFPRIRSRSRLDVYNETSRGNTFLKKGKSEVFEG